MTPPVSKPDPSAQDTSSADAASPGPAENATGIRGPRLAGGGNLRNIRLAAGLPVGAARRRLNAANATPEDEAATQAERVVARKANRAAAAASPGAGTRLGPKARARAARLASEADERDEEARPAQSQPKASPAAKARAENPPATARKTGPTVAARRKALAAKARAAASSSQANTTSDAPPSQPVKDPVVPSAPMPATQGLPALAQATPEPVPAATQVETAIAALVPTPVATPALPPAPVPAGTAAPGDVVPAPAPAEEKKAPTKTRRSSTKSEPRVDKPSLADPLEGYVIAAPAATAQMRPRHYGVLALFLLMVVLPTLSYSWYLWTRAADQYESDVGFGSRSEDTPSTFDFLGALGGAGKSSSKDMDILYRFIVSQELVTAVDKKVNLRAIYSKPENDPLNRFAPHGTIEDLVEYWQRMVLVDYDTGTGLMQLQVFAFDPKDAQDIANAVLEASTKIINDLSLTAQIDTTRYSKDALTATQEKLSEARLAVLDYQVKNRIVDPSNEIASQTTIVGTLNQQLANAQIELDMLLGTVPESDPRIGTLNRRIGVIQNRIVEEQSKVGAVADSNSPGYAKLVQDFGKLRVEQEFAEKAYLQALAAYDQALADAQQKTRYLATYMSPTLAEAPTAPVRPFNAFLAAIAGFILWAITVLVYYALRDRR